MSQRGGVLCFGDTLNSDSTKRYKTTNFLCMSTRHTVVPQNTKNMWKNKYKMKYLGLILDKKLAQQVHTTRAVNKDKMMVNLFRSLAGARWT